MKSLTTSSEHQLLSSQNQLLNPKSYELNPNSVKSTHNIPEDDIMNYETLINKLAKGMLYKLSRRVNRRQGHSNQETTLLVLTLPRQNLPV